MDQVAVVEYRDRGRAGAHVDHRGAEVDLVLDQRGEACGIGREDDIGDVQPAARQAGHQGAHGTGGRRHHMHVDAQAVAVHAAWIADALGAVDGIADGHAVDQLAVG